MDNESAVIPIHPDQSSLHSNSTLQSSDQSQQHNSFKTIIDNLDVSVKTRFVRSGTYENKSLHYINSYAVQGRINFGSLVDVKPHSCANSPERNATLLLPSAGDDKAMRDLFITHVSRILTSEIEYFKFTFDVMTLWTGTLSMSIIKKCHQDHQW